MSVHRANLKALILRVQRMFPWRRFNPTSLDKKHIESAQVVCVVNKQAKFWIRTAMMWLMLRAECINGMAQLKEENRNESSDYWRGCRRDVICHSSKKIK